MNADLRASLLVGAVAAGLSMLVGILSRVSFLALVFRALFFGVIFGGLAWGAATILRSFVPELFTGAGGSGVGPTADEEVGDETVGGAVDIVLDDEAEPLPVGDAADVPVSMAVDGGGADAVDVEPEGGYSEAGAGDSFARRATAAPAGGPGFDQHPSAGVDELDILPDLDAFSGSFGSLDLPSTRASEGYASPSGMQGGGSASGASPMAGPGGADPATLAMAVRTLLKRDQKG